MEMNTRFNYYDILEVNPQSSQNDISEAYNRARKTYSSDNPALYTIFTPEETREYLRMVEEAYSVLGNRTLRSLYNQKIGKGVSAGEQLNYDVLLQESKIHRPVELPKMGRLKSEYSIDEKFEDEIREQTLFTGPFLKRVREYKRITLEQMSSVTKVIPYYLSAIESMDVRSLPAPVFVRGYVTQIARHLGLPEKKVVESYMSSFRETVDSASGQ